VRRTCLREARVLGGGRAAGGEHQQRRHEDRERRGSDGHGRLLHEVAGADRDAGQAGSGPSSLASGTKIPADVAESTGTRMHTPGSLAPSRTESEADIEIT